MQKKIISLIIIVLLIVLAFLTCNNAHSVTKIEGISITIKEGTITKNNATIVITNNSKEECSFGTEYEIEHKVLGKWKKLKTKEAFWILPLYVLEPGKSYEDKIDWTDLYGKLKNGTYRFVKEINDKRIAVTFEIK